jgi:hypothetical protein
MWGEPTDVSQGTPMKRNGQADFSLLLHRLTTGLGICVITQTRITSGKAFACPEHANHAVHRQFHSSHIFAEGLKYIRQESISSSASSLTRHMLVISSQCHQVPKVQLGHDRAERVGADIPKFLSMENIEAAY